MKLGHNLSKCIDYIYYTLCTSAFIWQSTLVSINYFQFLVSSTINFRSPGYESIKPVTLCLKVDEVMNVSLYGSLCKNRCDSIWGYPAWCDNNIFTRYCKSHFVRDRMKIFELFNLSPDKSIIGMNYEQNFTVTDRFLLGEYVCYKILPEKNNYNHSNNYNLTTFSWFGEISTVSNPEMFKFRPGKYRQ